MVQKFIKLLILIFVIISINSCGKIDYEKEARNTKKISDIWKINSQLNTKFLDWVPLKSFIIKFSEYKWNDIKIGWKNLVLWDNYFIGTPNYPVIGIKKEDFLGLNWEEYVIWVTTELWWKYQILTFIEWKWESESLTIWTYKPRQETKLTKWVDFTLLYWKDNIINLRSSVAGLIKKNDILSWNTVEEVWSNWVTITFEKKVEKEILILEADSKSLFLINWKVVETKE